MFVSPLWNSFYQQEYKELSWNQHCVATMELKKYKTITIYLKVPVYQCPSVSSSSNLCLIFGLLIIIPF